jgi:DNA excision repair protein ERCC-2
MEFVAWGEVIVGDFNYVFNPTSSLGCLTESTEHVLIVDEAHNLVDRSREMFSAELRRGSFRRVAEGLEVNGTDGHSFFDHIDLCFAEYSAKNPIAQIGCDRSPPVNLTEPLEGLLQFIEGSADLTGEDQASALLRLYHNIHRFLSVLEDYDDRYATCFEASNLDTRLRLFCVDPSPQLEEIFTRCQSVVFLSATLRPTDYFRRTLGCASDARELRLPTPFDGSRLAVIVYDAIQTTYRKRAETRDDLVQVLEALVLSSVGNYLIYLPSYEYLEMVSSHFSARNSGLAIQIQTPSMTIAQRADFLNEFRKLSKQTIVGFAVLGGIFAEGIDLVGDALTGVAIVGVGLPAICPEREMIRSHFSEAGRDGYDFAYRFPGLVRVLQAAGRVIRTETDRGVLLLVDQRFEEPRYADWLPSHWDPARLVRVEDLAAHLKSFWGPQDGT